MYMHMNCACICNIIEYVQLHVHVLRDASVSYTHKPYSMKLVGQC